MTDLSIDKQTYRRFLMGRQGLWPGRRWAGREGVAQAVRECESIQIDPISVMARSHDIAMWGRVADYHPDMLFEIAYADRSLFDYGGVVMYYPMEELPYWRIHMQRIIEEPRWVKEAEKFAAEIEIVRQAIRERGPLGNRDFDGPRTLTNYRAGKGTGVGLYYLWLGGELMTHHREKFDRIMDFTENIAPPEYQRIASVEEAETFFFGKSLRELGMARMQGWRTNFASFARRKVDPAEMAQRVKEAEQRGEVLRVRVEGLKEEAYLPAADLPLIETLQAGDLPAAWQPIGPTTLDEVTFLAPLDMVSARGRAKVVFSFDYVWEVYKPADKRRWGYYVLPVLYGDRLVARLDAKLDRKARTFQVLGFWLEDHQPEDDAAFIEAFGRGLASFARFHEAESVDASGIPFARIREVVEERIEPQRAQRKKVEIT